MESYDNCRIDQRLQQALAECISSFKVQHGKSRELNENVAEAYNLLQGWDTCVFGAPVGGTGAPPAAGGGKKPAAKDADTRPENKVLLLCGAPGP